MRPNAVIPNQTRRLFFISIIVFIIIYLFWFRLTPYPIPYNENVSNHELPQINLRAGLKELQNYILFGALFLLVQERKFLRVIFLIPAILYFGASFLTATTCFPSVVDTAEFNGVTYYLTYNHHCILDTHVGGKYLTVWEDWSHYNIFLINEYGFKRGDKIIYDEPTNTISIIFEESNGDKRLVFLFDGSPRRFDWYKQFENHLYYLNEECETWSQVPYGGYCKTQKLMIYQCKTDNTSCAPLPMQYTGMGISWSYMEVNEATDELDFYIERYEDMASIDIKVYSYGKNPHCYVEGCEILSQP